MTTPHVPDLQPTVAEVMQVEPPATPLVAVPVLIEGPVRVQQHPRKSAAGRTIPITVNAIRLLPADPHRAQVTIIGIGPAGSSILVGFQETAFSGDAAAVTTWPVGSPMPVLATTELWVASDGTSTKVSYYRENWAQG